MSEIEARLVAQLKACESMPFLFVGSGISQRYIQTEPWEGLLRLFASYALPNEKYAYELYKEPFRHSGENPNSYLPKIATAIESDFNKVWYTHADWKQSRDRNGDLARVVSPFKISIAEHFCSKHLNITSDAALQKEISLLKALSEKSVSGIITTNYDTLLESIFDKFKIFIGQEELLFSNHQSVAEIYKIHGCCSKSQSIVINSHDYNSFHQKNAYLAAKLLTIFVEHPVIFLGYSLNDSDIEQILKAIIECLSHDNLSILQNRLIFVEYDHSATTSLISTHDKSFSGGKTISMTKITTSDFSLVFNAVLQNKSKYPTSILRKLKEDIYKLVLTNDPKGNLFVKEFDDIKPDDDIEIYAGLGILRDMGLKGYGIISVEELYWDTVFDDKKLVIDRIVDTTLPRLLPDHSYSVPIYKYIQNHPPEQVPAIIQTNIKTSFDALISSSFIRQRETRKYHSIEEVLKKVPFPKCLRIIATLPEEEVDTEALGKYLRDVMQENLEILKHEKPNVRTDIKRLIKIYDWLKYYKKQ